MSVKIKKTFSVEKATYLALEALSNLKGASMSSLLDKIVKDRMDEELRKNPLLKLEMIELETASPQEQSEAEQLLSLMSPEDLKPVSQAYYNPKTGEVELRKL